MGNHQSSKRDSSMKSEKGGTTGSGNGHHRKKSITKLMMTTGSSSPTTNGADSPTAATNSKPASQLLPVEKLAKILTQKTQQEESVHGVGLATFSKYLFPRYPVLAEKLFKHFHTRANSKHDHLTSNAFKQQCDKLFSILDDDTIRDNMVMMFADDHCESGPTMSPDGMKVMLMCAYHVSMDHYSEGPQMCLVISKTLKSVVDSCFHTKMQLSVQFVSHWLEANCPRLITPLHRYAVHSLATSYRSLEIEGPSLVAGLELATPVLEQPPPFGDKPPHPHLLQMSMSWLLAGALPPLYSRPQKAHSPTNSGVGLTSIAFLSKFLCSVPSHWINLYDSDEMGLGANRFLHHVLAYKGATLTLLKAEGGSIFCIAAPCEWKETHVYWGGEESCCFQLFPKFAMLEKGSKMLYLNTSVRGYPLGLRAGKDPRAPIISVEGGFDKLQFRKIPYNLQCIEVWGCGDQSSREVQLDIKKWQVKEAERQRCVKLSAADWLDHPDRYLLELAGRPQYHQKQN
ncbi:PREDICTED: uncharacterized protein LOC108561192 isoform X2 [Nicrophorus vespilloides]|uniref:Uncharacterized protein LOC108561192 isoform X2 n=1 Tax=Nicrophorus vespilloides TaxID=110193 RepID=A0ABM1MIW9_NICVS|nr:PREDICTED: uncharacterized protein LOC108561192 isoform X2 [Nicrophorus vespilloides]